MGAGSRPDAPASSPIPGLWPTRPTQSTELDRAQARANSMVLRRVVEADLLLQLDPARPVRGKNLGGLLGAQRARVEQNRRRRLARDKSRDDPAGVRPPSTGEGALVIVLAYAGLGFGVTDQIQAAHGRRLRRRFFIRQGGNMQQGRVVGCGRHRTPAGGQIRVAPEEVAFAGRAC